MITYPETPRPSRTEAARFLSHAALGHGSADIEAVQQLGYEAWINRQFTTWAAPVGHWEWLTKYRFVPCYDENGNHGPVGALRRFIESRDLLRQKMVFAIHEVVVASVANGPGQWHWGTANLLDIIEKYAFDNYRKILLDVSKTNIMGWFLTFRGSRAAGLNGRNKPDENYARELMQLFTIGLHKLNMSGQPVNLSGAPTTDPQEYLPTYLQEDVTTLARVFTGWSSTEEYDITQPTGYLNVWRVPMTNYSNSFDNKSKEFSTLPDGSQLLPTIPANLTATENMSRVINGLVDHPNCAPFISRQLIQRFVTSNPSPAYVARVATAFNEGGAQKGDLKAVIKAILLDPDLFENGRRVGGMSAPEFGKLKEPLVRAIQWAKAFNARSKTGKWLIGNSVALNKIGQLPMLAPSVFNFFRPGYVPANTQIAQMSAHGRDMVAPEFQITNEVTNLEYLTALAEMVDTGFKAPNYVWNPGASGADVLPDYSPWLPRASDPKSMVDELNILLAAGQLSPATVGLISSAVSAMPYADTKGRTNRVKAAVMLVMASPEYLSQK